MRCLKFDLCSLALWKTMDKSWIVWTEIIFLCAFSQIHLIWIFLILLEALVAYSLLIMKCYDTYTHTHIYSTILIFFLFTIVFCFGLSPQISGIWSSGFCFVFCIRHENFVPFYVVNRSRSAKCSCFITIWWERREIGTSWCTNQSTSHFWGCLWWWCFNWGFHKEERSLSLSLSYSLLLQSYMHPLHWEFAESKCLNPRSAVMEEPLPAWGWSISGINDHTRILHVVKASFPLKQLLLLLNGYSAVFLLYNFNTNRFLGLYLFVTIQCSLYQNCTAEFHSLPASQLVENQNCVHVCKFFKLILFIYIP